MYRCVQNCTPLLYDGSGQTDVANTFGQGVRFGLARPHVRACVVVSVSLAAFGWALESRDRLTPDGTAPRFRSLEPAFGYLFPRRSGFRKQAALYQFCLGLSILQSPAVRSFDAPRKFWYNDSMLTPSVAVKLARENITEEEFVSIFRSAVELAKQGDKQARDWVSNLVLPKEPDKEGIVEDRVREFHWHKISPEESERIRAAIDKAVEAVTEGARG